MYLTKLRSSYNTMELIYVALFGSVLQWTFLERSASAASLVSGSSSEDVVRWEEKLDRMKTVEDDFYRNASELVTSKGYPCKEYQVVTDDGFILTMQRIPHGRGGVGGVGGANRPVVFLQHGFLDAATTWIINSAAQSLGFILADAGFDVWLGNVRGNTYSRQHVHLKPKDHRFWQWSWDEMAKYDIPAMLKYILSATGRPHLFYVGHSQGTLVAFATLSQDPVLAKQVRALVALGPVITVGHVKGAAKFLSRIEPEFQFLFDLFGIDEFLPNSKLLKFLGSLFCSGKILRYACENIVFLLSGPDYKQLNASRIPVYVSHSPAGSSVQNVIHFSQMVKSNRFQMYDYGSEEMNVRHYNASIPPIYNITAFDVPTYVYSADRDFLSDPQDVSQLVSQLRSLRLHRVIPGWEHLDFVWGMDANKVLYKEIVGILKKLSSMN